MDDKETLPFGRRIRQLRLEKRMSQRDLSERVGIDFTYLSKIENSRTPPPSDHVIRLLAQELETDVEELLALAAKVSQEDLREAVAGDRRIGVLFRKLQSRSLTEEQIRGMFRIVSDEGPDDASDD